MIRESRGRNRTGFTLIETIVALAIGSLVILMGRAIAETLSESAQRIRAAALASSALANSDRTLRATLGRVETDTSFAESFEGSSQEVRFTTWCDTPTGWQERCRAQLSINRDSVGTTLTLGTRVTGQVRLRTDPSLIRIGYLASSDTGVMWLSRWERSAGAPAAIAVLSLSDTTILRVGAVP